MSRRSILSVIVALMAILVVALPVLAGGVVVTLDGLPSDVESGSPFTVGFNIFSAHDGSPQSGFQPTVTATNPVTQEKITVTAEPEGDEGHYVATLTLPVAGEWQWEIQPFGQGAYDYPASVMTPLQVGEAAVLEAPVNLVAPVNQAAPADVSPSAVTPGLIAAAVLVLGMAVLIAVLRTRQRVVAHS
jgi:hypothetical protein